MHEPLEGAVMATQAEMRAEELVYEVAQELGLTEAEVLRLDALGVAAGALRRLRIELRKQAGRSLTVHDYRLPDSPSASVVDLERSREDSVEA
jgi:predicted transcriptional regulator